MRQLFSVALLYQCCLSLPVSAQSPFNTRDSVDINNITASVLVHGDMWWDPVRQVQACQYPAHAATNINSASALWMSGYDAGNSLHIAAQTYRQTGNDYWPGPLDASGPIAYATSQNWAKIWKVNRTDIQLYQALSTHTTANTPPEILTWPGKGNTHAAGNGGVALTITNDMAPFVDLNSNGVYEPLSGEYPDVPGDQALWWVFNDNGPTHTVTSGNPMGVEVHAMSYAYKRGTLIDNVVYYDYTMVNRSANSYHDCRLGQWDDIDIGYFGDDFIAFDSVRRMAIGYNGNNNDGITAGFPRGSYRADPPQGGITMVVLPGDAGTNYVPAGSFVYLNNNASEFGNPTTDAEYNYYLRGRARSGKPLDSVLPTTGPCSITNPNYAMPGDPAVYNVSNECTCNNLPDDRRALIASNNFTLNAGGSVHAVFALVVADSAKGCSASGVLGVRFDDIRTVADTAWHIYHNPLPPITVSVHDQQIAGGKIDVYPNPAHDALTLEYGGQNMQNASLTVYNAIGQVVSVPTLVGGQQCKLDISHLPAGLYSILYRNGAAQGTARFVKK